MPSPSAPLYTRDYILLNAANLTFSLYTTIFIFLPAYRLIPTTWCVTLRRKAA